MMAKTAPYPLAHRDFFLAKDYGHCPDGRRVTQNLPLLPGCFIPFDVNHYNTKI